MKFQQPIYTDKSTVTIPLKNLYITDQQDNTNVEITIDWSCEEYSGMPNDATLTIKRTTNPPTPTQKPNSLYKWGGYPEFVQTPIQPISDDGRLYHYICTIKNDWGDMGNANIFALIAKPNEAAQWKDDQLQIEDIFVEASCS